ncbi:EF-hand domain-containing protein [Sphingobium algorifonticola]|uniref:Calcium-binding protein n=1 Tax=Sphingobium algorifonticola TaxID=2008318 RepID=A0A437JB94_9SPHN|nr:EF-hand domain-containing protein [Sphingobium algorifonticola]RVT43177.1 calcium-binding protein [Sphingobium algorifonticola]
MKKLLISTALGAFLVGGGIAIAQPDTGAGASAMRGPMRAAMMADTNKDGKLTKAEVTAAADQAFAKIDLNKDGKVTKEERETLRQQRFDARFATMDADKNGQISKAEFQATRDARMEKAAAWREARAERGGADGQRMGRMARRGGMMGGRGMDADKDGTITRAEFMARPVAMFDRADADKDGTVTAEEMKAARPGRGMKSKWRDMAPPPPAQN